MNILFIDQQLGRNLARTFLDYYKNTNYIAWPLCLSTMSKLKEDRIKPRSRQQSTNTPITDSDEVYEIKLFVRFVYLCNESLFLFSFLNNETFNLSTQEFIYPYTRNNNEPE